MERGFRVVGPVRHRQARDRAVDRSANRARQWQHRGGTSRAVQSYHGCPSRLEAPTRIDDLHTVAQYAGLVHSERHESGQAGFADSSQRDLRLCSGEGFLLARDLVEYG